MDLQALELQPLFSEAVRKREGCRVLLFPRPGLAGRWAHAAALALPSLHRLSQSPRWWCEEPRGHRASAPGSAVSEVTGGTPVLCK